MYLLLCYFVDCKCCRHKHKYVVCFLLLLLTSCHWWPLLEHFPNHQQSFREHSGRSQPLEFPCAWHCPSGHQTRASSPSAHRCISLHKYHGNQSVWWTHESLDDLRSTTERDTRFFSLTMSKFWKAHKDHHLHVVIVKTLGVGGVGWCMWCVSVTIKLSNHLEH